MRFGRFSRIVSLTLVTFDRGLRSKAKSSILLEEKRIQSWIEDQHTSL
jgi:hypothetical protein